MNKKIICMTVCALAATSSIGMFAKEPAKIESKSVKPIDLSNMDTRVKPGDDFYRYACGGWMDKHPLTPKYPMYGTFIVLRDNSQKQVKNLIVGLSKEKHSQGSLSQKIGDLYAEAMDSVRLNKEKADPLKPYLEEINALNSKDGLTSLLGKMFRNGMGGFFSFYVYADDKNSSMNILHVAQGSLGMGDRDYYLQNDARITNIRTKYTEMLKKLFILSGFSEIEAANATNAVLGIETDIAKVEYSRVQLRSPEANYHKINLSELQQKSPVIHWADLFEGVGLKGVKDLNLGQPEPIAALDSIIKAHSLEEIKYYLQARAILSASSYMSDAFSSTAFDFYGKTLSGQKQPKLRWERAVNAVNESLGEAIGQLYVAKYFPPENKAKMLQLVKNLQVALGEHINASTWMGDSTKEKALEKLAAFHIKIGYPDKWRDYSNLEINPSDSYFNNIVKSNVFDFNYMINKFGKPVDKNEWEMTPQTVNAYYNPTTNEICFPAAILQPPFFNVKADDAINYGAIGVVIGHEMTHGFDDQGRLYDKNGNLSEWWTAKDAENFKKRADVMAKYFDNIVVLDTIHANGELTLGENLADHGGLQIAWTAYQNTLKGKPAPKPIDGFTDAQRFFLAYAFLWANNISNEMVLNLTKIDPHALGKWRVDGALPHIDEWYKAFHIKEGDKMYLPKEKRVNIW